MFVLAEVEGREAAVGAARGHHRDLALEGHEAFEDQRRAAELREDRVAVALAGLADDALALAVVAEAAGLQHRRQADGLQGTGEVVRRVHGPERRRGDAEPIDEFLLREPVLGRRQGLGVRVERRVAGQHLGGGAGMFSNS